MIKSVCLQTPTNARDFSHITGPKSDASSQGEVIDYVILNLSTKMSAESMTRIILQLVHKNVRHKHGDGASVEKPSGNSNLFYLKTHRLCFKQIDPPSTSGSIPFRKHISAMSSSAMLSGIVVKVLLMSKEISFDPAGR